MTTDNGTGRNNLRNRVKDKISNPEYRFYYPLSSVWLAVISLIAGAVYLWHLQKIETEVLAAFIIALVGWMVGASYLTNRTRVDLEIEAVKDVRSAMYKLQDAFMTASVKSDSRFIALLPDPLPQYYWHNQGLEKHEDMEKLHLEMLTAYGAFYMAIENHEMALAPLWHYYRYINIDIDKKFDDFRDYNSAFFRAISDLSLTEAQFKRALRIYSPMKTFGTDVAVLLLDFRKAMHNNFFVSIFHKQLKLRKSFDGSKILQELATKADVARRMREREEKFKNNN